MPLRLSLKRSELSLCAALVLTACHAEIRHEGRASLAGHTVMLTRVAEVTRFESRGTIAEKSAIIRFDVSVDASFITSGCSESLRAAPEQVLREFPLSAKPQTFAVVVVEQLIVDGTRLQPFRAGLITDRTCTVTLGRDLLGNGSFTASWARAQLTFSASAQHEPPIRVEGHPTQGWWLFPLRLTQLDAQLISTFEWSTAHETSAVFAASAMSSRLQQIEDVVPVHDVAFDAQHGLQRVGFRALEGAPPNAGVAGRLGWSAWFRGDVVFDAVNGGLWVRPTERALGPERDLTTLLEQLKPAQTHETPPPEPEDP